MDIISVNTLIIPVFWIKKNQHSSFVLFDKLSRVQHLPELHPSFVIRRLHLQNKKEGIHPSCET